MGMAGQRLAGDLLGQRRWSPAASRGIAGIPGSSCRVTVPPSALPGAAVPSGMMSFPCWLWHCLLGHGCWPGDRERTVWAHGDGQMVSQGGGKVQLASLFYSPFLLQISISLDPPVLELHRDSNDHLKSPPSFAASPRRSRRDAKSLFIILWEGWEKPLPTPAQAPPPPRPEDGCFPALQARRRRLKARESSALCHHHVSRPGLLPTLSSGEYRWCKECWEGKLH